MTVSKLGIISVVLQFCYVLGSSGDLLENNLLISRLFDIIGMGANPGIWIFLQLHR